MRLQKQSEPATVDTAVVADDRQLACPLFQEGVDEKPGNTGQSETADRQARPVGDVGDGVLDPFLNERLGAGDLTALSLVGASGGCLADRTTRALPGTGPVPVDGA